MQHLNRRRINWKVYDNFIPMPDQIYRSKEAPTDVTTFEGVMLEHVDYVIRQSQIEKHPDSRAYRGTERDFGTLFGSVWRAQKLPKMPRGLKGFPVRYHGTGEISAGWYWRKGKPDAAKKVWKTVREQNPMFLKIMEPLTSMGVSEKQKYHVGLLWELHLESLKEYFKAVPRYRPKNLSRPKKVCLAFAAEFGALLDKLAARRHNSVESRITFDKIGESPKEVAIRVYSAAVKEAEQFIIAKINRALGTIKDVEKFEVVINLFGDRLIKELTKFKLDELRKAATVAGATRRELAKMQMKVILNGRRAIAKSIQKKREDPEYGFSALKEAAVIQTYKTAVEAVEQFIMAETKQDVIDRVETTPHAADKEYGEVAIDRFKDELMAKIRKLKLWELWQEALDAGATETQLGTYPRKVQMTGIRAFRRGIEKKKAEERSSRSNNKFKGQPTEFWN